MKRLLLFIVLVAAAGLAQNTNLFNFYGLKPDLTLAVLITLLPLVGGFYDYLAVTLAALFFIRSEIFALAALAAYPTARYLPWSQFGNNIFLITAGTLVIYLFSAPAWAAQNPFLVLGEVIYNLVLGSALYFVLWERNRS